MLKTEKINVIIADFNILDTDNYVFCVIDKKQDPEFILQFLKDELNKYKETYESYNCLYKKNKIRSNGIGMPHLLNLSDSDKTTKITKIVDNYYYNKESFYSTLQKDLEKKHPFIFSLLQDYSYIPDKLYIEQVTIIK